jgi:hypothetical protein
MSAWRKRTIFARCRRVEIFGASKFFRRCQSAAAFRRITSLFSANTRNSVFRAATCGLKKSRFVALGRRMTRKRRPPLFSHERFLFDREKGESTGVVTAIALLSPPS